jgi:hypothetical protein
VRRGIDDALPVLVDRIAEKPGDEERGGLRLELVGDVDGAACEARAEDAVALVVVDVERGIDAVLLRGVAEALGLRHGQRLIAELVPHDDGAPGERYFLDAVADEVRGRVGDPLAVLVRRIAEAGRTDDRGRGLAELVDEIDGPPREARRARSVALHVVGGGSGCTAGVDERHAEQDEQDGRSHRDASRLHPLPPSSAPFVPRGPRAGGGMSAADPLQTDPGPPPSVERAPGLHHGHSLLSRNEGF